MYGLQSHPTTCSKWTNVRALFFRLRFRHRCYCCCWNESKLVRNWQKTIRKQNEREAEKLDATLDEFNETRNDWKEHSSCCMCACVFVLFVSLLSTDQNKDVFRLWMSAYVFLLSCFLFYLMRIFCFLILLLRNRSSAEKSLLTKCVFRFTSSGYDIVTWIWWEFLYPYLIGWKKGKRVPYTIWMLRYGPKRKTVSKENLEIIMLISLITIGKRAKATSHTLIKYAMLFAFAFRFLQSLHSLSMHDTTFMHSNGQNESNQKPNWAASSYRGKVY